MSKYKTRIGLALVAVGAVGAVALVPSYAAPDYEVPNPNPPLSDVFNDDLTIRSNVTTPEAEGLDALLELWGVK